MEPLWFYLDGDQRRGPVTFTELIRTLLEAPVPHRALVWHEGLADWQEAGSIPEIRGSLPPPGPSLSPGGSAISPVPFADAEAIARLYRRLVLLVGLQILISVPQILLQEATPSTGVGLVALAVLLLLIGILVAMVITTYKLARLLGAGLPILWAIAMFIPCLNLLTLLVLSSKAQAWCQQYGIKVGLLGPTKESIEEVRRRTLTSTFD
jgi:hypothetical protein